MKKNEAREEREYTPQQSFLLYVRDVVYLLAILLLAGLLLFRNVIVSGSSMKNTLVQGDFLILVSNTLYNQPKQGDIVVISKAAYDDGKPIVKRIIATEGQTVDIDFVNGIVYVDDVALEENYIIGPTLTTGGTEFPLEVEKGHVFVMGDNRNNSRDSRFTEIGQIDEREILGKAIFLLVPGDPDGPQGPEKPDYSRIGGIS